MRHKHATAFDLVLWATMVGAFDLAEVLLKHKSCESPLRAAFMAQAPPPPPPSNGHCLPFSTTRSAQPHRYRPVSLVVLPPLPHHRRCT